MSGYQFARIDLSQTNYRSTVDCMIMAEPDIPALNAIYKTYCTYKRFSSVMPIFDSRYTDPMTDVLTYYDDGKMVAFSLIRRYDKHNALCDQFAWTYHQPKMRLGIETLKTECAIYKARGFQYLYLEQAHLYKAEIDGFEILGPLE
jgi:hypothetical protein